MKLECVFCKYKMEKNLPGPIDVIVCPSCKAKVAIEQINTTMPGEVILALTVLKEGKKK
jgi:uncharacterized protein YlaI